VIEQLAGSKPTNFRPPFGATNKDVQRQASQLGLTTIGWTIDTCDWTQTLQGGVTTDDIVDGVLNNVENGSIILMHDGGNDRSKTVAALERIITGLKSRDFKLVTVEQMVKKAHRLQPR
jgi:peptidoglycan/xylan/chitin deacetylase (PgdA/CDA1 family)